AKTEFSPQDMCFALPLTLYSQAEPPIATTKNSTVNGCRVLRFSVRKDYREYLAYPIVGITPSCCSMPSWSNSTQPSTTLPPLTRMISIPVTVIDLPVGGMP